MKKTTKPFFKKHLHLKVIQFNSDKTISINYYKKADFKPNFLINPNHIFNHKGFNTMVITDISAETIDPLNFKSHFKGEDFKNAIESKIIKETFTNLGSNKLDLVKGMLFANLGITLILLFMLMRMSDII